MNIKHIYSKNTFSSSLYHNNNNNNNNNNCGRRAKTNMIGLILKALESGSKTISSSARNKYNKMVLARSKP
jgi:hypothetical protein